MATDPGNPTNQPDRTQDARVDPLGDATRAMAEVTMTGAQLMDLIDERDIAVAAVEAARAENERLRNILTPRDEQAEALEARTTRAKEIECPQCGAAIGYFCFQNTVHAVRVDRALGREGNRP